MRAGRSVRRQRAWSTPRGVEGRRAAIRSILACTVASFGCRALGARAQLTHRYNLPTATDLAADAAAATRARVPILLFFDRGDCPYCERALREYLVPMTRDDAWRARAIYRQIEVDRELDLVHFDGRATTHRALAARYDAFFTPTVIVVDSAGTPLADALVGLAIPDFYGAYLERAIEVGERKLGK